MTARRLAGIACALAGAVVVGSFIVGVVVWNEPGEVKALFVGIGALVGAVVSAGFYIDSKP